MGKFTDPLHADYFYHVFNRTNNRELLFRDDEDRQLFLEKYKKYVMPYVDTYTFCLMGNHFHLVIRVKSLRCIYQLVQSFQEKERTEIQQKFLEMEEDLRAVDKVLSSQFNRLFTSYATHVNKKYKRKGNLFNRPFKRVQVENEGHFTRLIYYVHANPKKHGIQSDFQNYKWSSYQAVLSDGPTLVMREEVLKWFGGKTRFLEFHEQLTHEMTEVEYLMIED